MTSTLVDRINGLNEGVAFKAPCRLYAITNLPLYGLSAFEGHTPAITDRVLVKGQTNLVHNGIYIPAVGAWSRAPDFDGARDAVAGTLVQSYDPAVGTGVIWRLASPNPVVIGVSDIIFEVAVFVTPGGEWILATGFWNDAGSWDDSKDWID